MREDNDIEKRFDSRLFFYSKILLVGIIIMIPSKKKKKKRFYDKKIKFKITSILKDYVTS